MRIDGAAVKYIHINDVDIDESYLQDYFAKQVYELNLKVYDLANKLSEATMNLSLSEQTNRRHMKHISELELEVQVLRNSKKKKKGKKVKDTEV